MSKKILFLLFWVCSIPILNAQKISLNPLHGNATLIEYQKNQNKTKSGSKPNTRIQSTPSFTLSIPFYEEFSYAGPFPDTNKWVNSQSVFVNHTKAMAPPTLGVATLDGLNKFGYPYNSNIASNTSNTLPSTDSDTLLSAPIRLDSIPSLLIGLSPSDSIYFSFYYQGMGYWEKPDQGDYLYLDFYSPKDTSWTQIWSHDGYLYAPDSSWHRVMIPITDTSYFHDGFRFRFRNFSGACGDIDHWHLDVIYLNRHRTVQDTTFQDVSFVYDLESPLKNYSQMPFNQFSGASDMKKGIGTFLRNDFSQAVSISTGYSFESNTGSTLLSYIPGSNNLNPYYSAGYCNDTIIKPSLNNFVYPLSSSDSSFTFKFYIPNTIDTLHGNDTITFHQKFSIYFSYDDGSAEAGFAVNPVQGVIGETAVKFVLNKSDSLGAVDIFFDPIIDVNLLKTAPFNLIIRSDNAGFPGVPIYSDTLIRYPYFPDDTLVQVGGSYVVQRENHFLRYQLQKRVFINSGVFYISIAQTYTTPLNIGFDMNTDFHRNIFYNADGINWYVLPGDQDPNYRGSLMVHAVFGDSAQTASIHSYADRQEPAFHLFPNPASDFVFIQSTTDQLITRIELSDLLGNKVLDETGSMVQKINTRNLPPGVYLVKAYHETGPFHTQKLIIAR